LKAANDKVEVSPLAAGVAALRRFWRPFVLIQSAALLLVPAYHLSPSVRAACAVVAAWKTAAGWWFASISGAVAGGLVPELAKWLADRRPRRPRAEPPPPPRERPRVILFNTAFFAFNGLVIDGLYRFEALLFGGGAGVLTVLAKTAFDQFVFTPLWLVLVVALFLWRQSGFSLSATLPRLRQGFYRRRVLPLLIPNWCFWIPMVSIIYAFPVPLQFPLFTIALAAWSLIMVFIANG
jgi:hypothetical protein